MRRWLLPVALVVSWLATLPLLWRALTTLPSPERLQQSHMVRIPTVQTVWQQAGLGLVELCGALLATWPGRHARLRLWLGALVAWSWFFASTPLGLNTVQWVHRRWLAALALVLVIAALVRSLAPLVRGGRAAPSP